MGLATPIQPADFELPKSEEADLALISLLSWQYSLLTTRDPVVECAFLTDEPRTDRCPAALKAPADSCVRRLLRYHRRLHWHDLRLE